MSKYLITGGEGFIGSRIVKKVDGFSFDLKSGFDILNQDQIGSAVNGKDGVFHCAAKISVPESISQPDLYYKVNVQGTSSVISATEKTKAKIVFSSSAAVYGESDVAVTETSVLNPKSPYAQNKLDGEKLLEKSSVPHIALRYFNVYGPGQSSQYAGVITFFIQNAISGKDLLIYGDGNQIRDFVFIEDVVRANVCAMNYKNNSFEIFNIGSGIQTLVKNLAEMIIDLTGSSSKIVYAQPRPGDIVYSQADVRKAEKILGWKAEVSLEKGLEQTILYYKNLQNK